MRRHHWTTKRLARHVTTDGGFLGTRPELMFRILAVDLPELPATDNGGCYRPWSLPWPQMWRERFELLELSPLRLPNESALGWKYIDLWPAGSVFPRHVVVDLLGYPGDNVRPLLRHVAELLNQLEAEGRRLQVR